LCRELAREPGVEQILVTKRGSELARRAAQDGVPVAEVGWTLTFDPRASYRLAELAVRFRPHIVHAHDAHSMRFAVALAQGRLWRAYHPTLGPAPWFMRDWKDNHPLVVGTRRVDFHLRRRWRESPWVQADHVVAISAAVKEVLVSDGVRVGEITVVRDGVDPDEIRRAAAEPARIRPLLGLPPGTPLAVNVAALVDHKDQRTLIRAAQHARAARPDLHWAIAGEGRLRGSLTAEIARLGLADRVHLLGYVERADALIQESDVFVMSSKEEGLGSVILNALALGKPVVATAAGGIPEILPAAALVPVADAAALARKVLETLDHPSPVPLPPQFTSAAMAQGVLALYRSLL
jgi:L-malate glycosyltransferase